jgi:serine protease Do
MNRIPQSFRRDIVSRPRNPRRIGRLLLAGLAFLVLSPFAAAQDDLADREQQAMQTAAARAAQSTVRIETVGGLERVGQVLVGEGPTTGVIVSPDGLIVSSAFNFVQEPSSILVTLPDGARLSARRVASDHSRSLVLLKVDPPAPLTPAEAAPMDEVRVGLWAIAVGRTFERDVPNVSIGIVSAVGRMWGRAIQTDAKISPSNYGGPLVDLHGRVMGVLAPLSPQAGDAMAGIEWYDSGIGFAIPLADIMAVLPRWATGEDLHPGILGVSLRGDDIFVDPPVVAASRPNSPAYEAGLKADDVIVEVAGQPVERQAQVKQLLGPLYAGDKVKLVALRGTERIEREVELIAKLQPYAHPFLGILPLRLAADAPAAQGIEVRYVYPDSPAAKAGIAPGEVIVAAAGQPVASLAPLHERLAPLTVGDSLSVDVRHGEQVRSIELTLAPLPEALPGELPPARSPRDPPAGERPPTGRTTLKLPESDQECLLYVPDGYDPSVAHGLVLWFDATGAEDEAGLEALVARWRPLCDAADLVLMAPRSSNGQRWDPAQDLPLVRKLADQVQATYAIDASRVVAVGRQGGGALAGLLAMRHRDLVRGVIAIEAPVVGQLADNDPVVRQAFVLAAAEKSPAAELIARSAAQLREMKYPVTQIDLGESPRDLTEDEWAALVRWIDALDRS